MIVVTGATGTVGRGIVATLTTGGHRVTAVSRGSRAAQRDVPHVVADLGAPETLRPALRAADTLFLLVAGEQMAFGPDPRVVIDTAITAGVSRIVLLSSLGVATRPDSPAYHRIRDFENAVRESGAAWTVLRSNGFASNALSFAGSTRKQHTVAAPFGDIGLPLVDPADVAAVAAITLAADGHAGHTYVLTGPALVTPREQAAAIAHTLGVAISFAELSREQAMAVMLDAMPQAVAEATLEILGRPTAEEQSISPDVPRILGRPATAFAQWVDRNAAAFR